MGVSLGYVSVSSCVDACVHIRACELDAHSLVGVCTHVYM
jgi:hypothetical protein